MTILRFANVLGPDVETSHIELFSLPVVPMILGFDPRYQFVHEDDVVNALEHAVKHRPARHVFNVAGDGVLALSEVAGLLGQAVRAGPAAVGDRASRPRRCGGSAWRSRRRCSSSCASAAAWTTAAQGGRASATATRPARPS